MKNLLQDLRYALRIFRRQLWVVLAAVLTLGLGIGATAAIFGLVNAVYLQPLPFEGLDRLMQLERVRPSFVDDRVSAEQFLFWRQRYWEEGQWEKGPWREDRTPFEALAAYSLEPVIITAGGEGAPPELLKGCHVTDDFFAVFGILPRLGRAFGAEEMLPGRPPTVILSHRAWQRYLGGGEDVLGASLRLDGLEHEVVGVMPPDFDYPKGIDVWLPLQIDTASPERIALLAVSARLRTGISLEEAQKLMSPLALSFAEFRGLTGNNRETLLLRPFKSYLYGDERNTFLLLGGGGLFLLLIACANVINLQLARYGIRRSEIATRLALGGRLREILRLMLIENLALSAAGGVLGLGLCYFMMPVLRSALPESLPLFNEVEIDLTVAFFLFVVVALVGIATGLVPAFKARKLTLTTALRDSSARGGLGRRQQQRRLALVASQVALAVVLTIVALLMLKSSLLVSRVDPGVRREQILTVELGLSSIAHRSAVAWERLSLELLPQLAAVPGIETVAAATNLPMQDGPPIGFQIVGRDPNESNASGGARIIGVAPGYFAALDVPIFRGRAFDAGDDLSGEPVMVVNEAAAARFWPKEDPLDDVLVLGPPLFPTLGDSRLRRVVGIVGNVREAGFALPPQPILYVPLPQIPQPLIERLVAVRPLGLIFHTQVEPMSVARQVQEAIWNYDPDLPIDSMRPLASLLDVELAPGRYRTALVGIFAVLCLLLSLVGVYGVLTYLVTLRTREMAIRLAMGAEPRRIVRLILWHGMSAVVVGAGVGMAVAAAFSQVIGSLLVISPLDPLVFMAAPLFFFLLALGAMLLPALRAARVEPARALRFE